MRSEEDYPVIDADNVRVAKRLGITLTPSMVRGGKVESSDKPKTGDYSNLWK